MTRGDRAGEGTGCLGWLYPPLLFLKVSDAFAVSCLPGVNQRGGLGGGSHSVPLPTSNPHREIKLQISLSTFPKPTLFSSPTPPGHSGETEARLVPCRSPTGLGAPSAAPPQAQPRSFLVNTALFCNPLLSTTIFFALKCALSALSISGCLFLAVFAELVSVPLRRQQVGGPSTPSPF